MLEVIKIFANWGFPAALVLYLLWSYGKRMDKLDNTIGNHLTHALENNTEETKKNSESGDRVERAVIQMRGVANPPYMLIISFTPTATCNYNRKSHYITQHLQFIY